MKQLVLDAMNEVMDDELKWDELVGRLVTSPMRYSESLVWEPLTKNRSQKRVDDVLCGRGFLGRAPGISLATSRVISNDQRDIIIDRLFALGQLYEVENDLLAQTIFRHIEQGLPIDNKVLANASNQLQVVLTDLLVEGVLQYRRAR